MNHSPTPWTVYDKCGQLVDANGRHFLDCTAIRTRTTTDGAGYVTFDIARPEDLQHIVNCVNALHSIIRRLTDAGWFNTLLLDTLEERAVECVIELLEHYHNQHTERNT